METSLRFDSGKKHLKLFAKEKFSKIKIDEFKAAAAAKTNEFQVS